MEWHIITGEYPPDLGGVSDYTYQISQELAKAGDTVHVWTPANESKALPQNRPEVHVVPRGFGWHWLRELNRRLKSYSAPRNLLIQYVPHMYGWKSMNLAFCLWICSQRKQKVFIMFHEVAFPFRRGQPHRHNLLAVVHRLMASAILRSVRHSFTSTESYLTLLRALGSNKTPIDMLRICSNVPPESFQSVDPIAVEGNGPNGLFTIGVFSSFGAAICRLLEPVIRHVLENPRMSVLLIGPAGEFHASLVSEYPEAARRIKSTGRLHVTQVGGHMRSCDVLTRGVSFNLEQGVARSHGTRYRQNRPSRAGVARPWEARGISRPGRLSTGRSWVGYM